jgi:hypothetical protein
VTTDTSRRDNRPFRQQLAEYRRDLDELRSTMQVRATMQPDSPEFLEALAYEEELLTRIHEWSIDRD